MSKLNRTVRQAEAEARREQILGEAIRLIGLKGYRGFTLRQLANQCGLTNGGVLYHFTSKEAVLAGVLDELERRITVGLMDYVSDVVGRPVEESSSREVVLHIMRGLVLQACSEGEEHRLLAMLQIEALDPEHPAHEHVIARNRSTFSRFSELFKSLCDNPDRVARRAIALMNGYYLMWLEDSSFDMLAEWDHAISLILPEA
jgi:AcrR family transcriptional regulator